MIVNIQDEKQFNRDFHAYLEQYYILYSRACQKEMIRHFGNGLGEEFCADIITQIYSALGYIPNENDRYYGFVMMLKDMYGLDNKIVEVGAGYYPAVAKHIDSMQTSGTITTYDPIILMNELGRIIIRKEEFTKKTAIDDADLVIGFSPCEASELLINKANENNKEFSIAVCGCTHFDTNYTRHYSPRVNDWINYLYESAKEGKKDNESIEISYLDDKYEYPYPIISKIKKR